MGRHCEEKTQVGDIYKCSNFKVDTTLNILEVGVIIFKKGDVIELTFLLFLAALPNIKGAALRI